MQRLRLIHQRIRSLLSRRRVEDELDRELKLHLEQLAREYTEAGMSDADAWDAVRRAFGSTDLAKEECRDARGVRLLDDLASDLAYGWRLLVRSPAFTLTAVLSLALGLGANTAVFSLVDTVVLRSLPVERPQELFFLQAVGNSGTSGAPPYPCFERLRSNSSGFSGAAAFAADEMRVQVAGSVEQVFGQAASGNYYDVLGLKPAIRRLFTADDERMDPPVAVISHAYWQHRFGGSPQVVGQTITVGDRLYTIVGVTPAQFWGLHPGRHVEVTVPITVGGALLANSDAWWFDAVVRLKPGATAAQASAPANTIFQAFMQNVRPSGEIRRQHFDRLELRLAGRGLERLRSRFSTPLFVLTLVAAMVLLIACANLGNLLLVRGVARGREFAIRLATGAGAGRLARQLVTETLLLFLLGALASLVVAHVVVRTLTGFFAIGRNPILLDVQYDWRLAGFVTGVTLVAGLLTGLWPALRAARIDPQAAMNDGGARVAGARASAAAGRLLLTSQVALAFVLLVSAVVLGTVAGAAAWLPARRAGAIDPAEALRGPA